MVRLVFRPYTQIRRTICTSVSLRASTRVSPGFTLFRHRSPSFGSLGMCSYSKSLTGSVDSAGFDTVLPITFIAHQGLTPKYSHMPKTPWSVFQDGSMKTVSSASRAHGQISQVQHHETRQNFVLPHPGHHSDFQGPNVSCKPQSPTAIGTRNTQEPKLLSRQELMLTPTPPQTAVPCGTSLETEPEWLPVLPS
jgi:hypothetical protein